MATMKQVAERAGVSISTVSHVINNTRVVSDDVRQRVLGVIAEMRYIPSAVARSLKNDKTNMIGVLVPDSSNPYFAELIRWLEDAAFEAGYNIILCNAQGGAAKQAAYLRLLMEKRIDGLVLVVSSADRERELLTRAETVPIIQIERALPGLEADAILAGEPGGAAQAAHHLLELGHRDIACVAGPASLPRTRERLGGFLRAMEEAGRPVPRERIVHEAFTSAGGYAAFNRLLTSDRPPSAIFATSDLMAFGGLWAAREIGVRVPEQLSVIGFDDLDGVGYTSPPLTTVAPPKRDMARLALAWLVERIRGGQAAQRRTALESRLVLRATCAPPR
ncbi:LacI family DNA-binding transcriptional regulator [Massilia sp. YIM B02763]|uniref:LacI family DNA-binding transcriptional regulator n=1 Tax=Massilia sp. YIM B02763 TaxID=3050130 RepID=UPI0025B63393|nr:LacI family DNA-binding transcriptional regulator [Massilia sp. YIM B02763]MDN4055814.1 LacI family DNA-binding transcriptional regulator [Massilia sp. YIM B02763]